VSPRCLPATQEAIVEATGQVAVVTFGGRPLVPEGIEARHLPGDAEGAMAAARP